MLLARRLGRLCRMFVLALGTAFAAPRVEATRQRDVIVMVHEVDEAETAVKPP